MPTSSTLPLFFAAAEPHRLAVLRALWPAVVGEALAQHSEVVGIQGDVMRIRADSASWLKTLRDLRGSLIHRVQKAGGSLAPRGLAFVEGPLTARPGRRPTRKRLRPLPISELPPEIAAAVGSVPTAEGRETCLRAATAFKARFAAPRP